jgi:hypothetical protein
VLLEIDYSHLVVFGHGVYTVQDVSERPDISFFVVVELTVACALLEVVFANF